MASSTCNLLRETVSHLGFYFYYLLFKSYAENSSTRRKTHRFAECGKKGEKQVGWICTRYNLVRKWYVCDYMDKCREFQFIHVARLIPTTFVSTQIIPFNVILWRPISSSSLSRKSEKLKRNLTTPNCNCTKPTKKWLISLKTYAIRLRSNVELNLILCVSHWQHTHLKDENDSLKIENSNLTKVAKLMTTSMKESVDTSKRWMSTQNTVIQSFVTQ